MQGEGFEPPKAEPDDLQSPVFDRFTIPATLWSRQRDSNPRPAVYKTAALATELCRRNGVILPRITLLSNEEYNGVMVKNHETRIPIGDGRSILTEYKIFGETSTSAPVGAIFANGWGCPPDTTERPAAALAEVGIQVVTFEPDPTAKLTTENRATIMRTLAQDTLGSFIAMGFSLGGDVASRVAYTDYETNTRDVLGLVDVAGKHDITDRHLITHAGRMEEADFVDGVGFPKLLDFLQASDRESVHTYGKHVAGMNRAMRQAYHFAAADSMREADEGGTLHTLLSYHGGPVFYIHGDEELVPYLGDIGAQSHITEIEIPNARHFLHEDAPAAYAGALARSIFAINNL